MDFQTLLKSVTNNKFKHLSYDKRDPTKGLNTITYLSLDNKQLERIENLQYCTSISCIYLSENFISSLSGAFSGHPYKNLVQLNLDDNRIQKIEGLESLSSLKKLYLEKNCIARLEGLARCTSLEELYLSKQRLPDFVEFQFSDEDSLIGLAVMLFHIYSLLGMLENITH